MYVLIAIPPTPHHTHSGHCKTMAPEFEIAGETFKAG